MGRFRSHRWLALVDTRRDALANPARVSRLWKGDGYALGEVDVAERQGSGEVITRRDLGGTRHAV